MTKLNLKLIIQWIYIKKGYSFNIIKNVNSRHIMGTNNVFKNTLTFTKKKNIYINMKT